MEFQGGSEEEVEIELVAAGVEVSEATQFALLGKIVVGRDLNRKGVINVLRSIWNARDLVDVRELGNNIYGISFANEKGMEFAMENGPWSVFGHSLVLRRWEVEIDVKKPLMSGFWVPRVDKERIWAEIRYERLADFCYNCGRLGHIEKNCEYAENQDRVQKYGAWMCVGPARDKGRGDGVWKRWDKKGSPMLQADYEKEKIAEKAAWV
ncbi:Zinc finger, CCHC-type [Corchorus capsularis]|uniref:Zinc finger, CCHC-type n=1 Tax=Corchorus capsularis TaxID=210143 RepID=A0A1R3FY57_COCAP|nr:Zinc finger, CCHC-type [Corchorus capsularis]